MDDRDGCAALLSCPVCAGSLADAGGSARCEAGHSFDYARSGYLNLVAGGRGSGRLGDSTEMVRAREELLAAGHFEPLAAALGEAAAEAEGPVDGCRPEGDKPQPVDGTVLAEVGSGTGHHLAAVAAALGAGGHPPRCAFGFDLSKAACERAARGQHGLRFVVADVEAAIPLRDAAADVVLSVFAPRPAPELGRIARPGGALVVALAEPDHLLALRERLGLLDVPADKLDRLRRRLEPWFEPTATSQVRYEAEFPAEDARRLVLMGPNARHAPDTGAIVGPHADLVAVAVASFRRRAR